MFQKFIAAIMAFFVSLGSLLGFGGKSNKVKVDVDKNVLANFSDFMSVEKIIDDTSNIDLGHKMDTTGLTKNTVKNRETGEIINYYYDSKNNLVYEVNEDWPGENFKYYTKSKSGLSLTVTYAYGEDFIGIRSDKYSFSRYGIHTKTISPYKCRDAYITAEDYKSSDPLRKSITYNYNTAKKVWMLWDSYYMTPEGLMNHNRSSINEKGEWVTTKNIVCKKLDKSPATFDFSVFGDKPYILDYAIYGNNVAFTESNGKYTYYFVGKGIIPISDKKQAESIAKLVNGKIHEDYDWDYDENGEEIEVTCYEVYCDLTVKFADNFTSDSYSIRRLAIDEIDDAFTLTADYNDSNEITGFNFGTISFY